MNSSGKRQRERHEYQLSDNGHDSEHQPTHVLALFARSAGARTRRTDLLGTKRSLPGWSSRSF
jgi:hypothetical protein